MDWQAFWVSVRLASLTTIALAVLGMPIAWWLAHSRCRWKVIVEAAVALPIALPPTVVGFYLLLAFGPRGALGIGWEAATGRMLPFTFEGILIASILFNLPFAVRPFAAGFATVDTRLLEAAKTLGASNWSAFWRVALPLSWPGVAAGLLLSFTHTIGEFGVVLMVGANVPGITRTLSTSIYDSVAAMDYAAAHRTALVMLVFAFVSLAALGFLQHRRGPLS